MPEEQVIPAEEQEETAASSIEATTATDSATGDSNESQSEGEQKPKGGFQRRIDALTRKAADESREKEFWRQEALRNKPVEAKVEAPTAEEPKEDDFDTHSAYVKALTKHTAQQAVEAYKAEQRTESAKTQQKTQQQQLVEAQKAFAEAAPDFHEVMADATDIQISPAMGAELQSPEYGPQLAYFLAKNPDEAEKLYDLGPLALARAIGKLESRFTKAPQKNAAKVTNAPAPPNPVGRSSPTSGKDPYKDDLSPKEYAEWRKTRPNG